MNELDHVILFLPGPDDVESLFPGSAGLILDPGTRHAGQGTRNRRVIFAECYLELVWVDSPAEARASGLLFEERCTGDGCPFGVVFRGRPPDTPGFVTYTVPSGPTLQILDDARLPFIGVFDIEKRDPRAADRRTAIEYVNRTLSVEQVQITAAATPPEVDIPRVSFTRGEPSLTLTVTGLFKPLEFRPSLSPSGSREWN